MTGQMGMDGAVIRVSLAWNQGGGGGGGGGRKKGTGSKKEGNSNSYLYSRLGDWSGCAA